MAKWVMCSLLVLINTSYANEKISWESGVLEVVKANPELSAAKSLLQSTQYQIKAARSGFFPTISASAGMGYDSTSEPKTYSASISAVENLFSGFSDSAKIVKANSVSSSSAESLLLTKAKLSYDLKTAYMGVYYSQKYIALTDDIIKRREANLKLVQLRFESGRENIGSLNLSKAYLAQAKLDHLQAVNSLEVYQSQLARVLGRETHDDLEVEGAVPTLPPPYENNRKINYKDLVRDMPDYKKSFFDEQTAKANLTLSKSTFYPELNLTESATRLKRESNSTNNSWSVAANLVFPLFSGGKDYYTYKSASEDYRASTLNRKNIEESSVTKLKDSYTAYVEAAMKVEVDEAFSLAASSRERIGKAQYNNGLISFNDWDIIENDLINRQKTLLQTQRDRVTAEAAWEQAQGKGVIP